MLLVFCLYIQQAKKVIKKVQTRSTNYFFAISLGRKGINFFNKKYILLRDAFGWVETRKHRFQDLSLLTTARSCPVFRDFIRESREMSKIG